MVKPDSTRRLARLALIIAIGMIALGYASAFMTGGAPQWAPWMLALGIPTALGGVMVLGATRGDAGIGPLKAPFAFVFLILAVGFSAALALPANEGPLSTLWLGLPTRAAIIIYGIGLFPIVVLPLAYALTFETQTLSAADIERVRTLAREIREQAAQTDKEAIPPSAGS